MKSIFAFTAVSTSALIAVVVFVPFVAHAQFAGPLVPCGGTGQDPCTVCHLYNLVDNLVNFLTAIAIPLATLAIIAGGFFLLTSGGSPGRRERGKSAISAGIIGVAIALGAWLIIGTIVSTFANDGAFLGAWNEFPTCN